jgi:hypothetical protein
VLHAEHIEARPRYIRYKPRNKATILYDVRVDDHWTSAIATVARRDLNKLLGRPDTLDLVSLARGRTIVSEPMVFLEEPKALVEWYPLNRALPGLLVEPSRVRDRLAARGRELGDSSEPELLIYKPERRAVLRWGDCILKVYASDEDVAQAIEGLVVTSDIQDLDAPTMIDHIPDARLTVQEVIPGHPMGDDRASRVLLGEAMARIRRSRISPTRIVFPEDHLLMARVTSRHVGFLLPDVAADLERVLGILESLTPRVRSMVPAHGDFNEDQALATTGGIALLDFDHVCLADPAFDPAALTAHRLVGSGGDMKSALQALEELLTGYGPAPEHLSWYLALATLRRSGSPFRFLASDWPDRIRRIIKCSSELASGALSAARSLDLSRARGGSLEDESHQVQ